VKRSKRQKKISKVMGEFKDGSLKSGGSGRKVTNPKQAIAIALSEAERMNQGGIVGLAQMGSPFTNSIRQPSRNQNQMFSQTLGPESLPDPRGQQNIMPQGGGRGFQGPQQMGPMQRNFMQMQNQMRGMQQNPLELYQGYLGQKYIGPMQQEQQNKISQFVGAVNQAEKQAFGQQQGGKTFGGRLQPGMPGSGLQNQPSILQPTNQAPDVMPPQGVRDISSANPDNYPSGIVGVGPVLQSAPLMNQGGARLMNQGGMMYSDIMNRPMFQTPQQRQGMGIMAGVAPVRGYANGGEVEDLGFMDYAREVPGLIKNMVVGDDGTMSDFFTTEKTPEGQGLTARDLFEFFIVDPEDPADVAIASATAGLMASGVGAPGAIAAQLGRMGYKGKKVADVVEKAVRFGVGDTRAKTFGRGQTARIAPALLGSEEAMAQEAAPATGGIASLPVEEVQVSAENPVTVEEIESLGVTAEEFAKLKPQVQQEYLQLLNDKRLAANTGYNIGSGIAGMGDILTAPVRGVGEGLEAIAQSRLGRVLGLSDPGDVDQPFEMFPMSESMAEGARRNAPATMEQLKQGLEPPTPPSAPAVSEVEEDPFASVTPESQAFVEQQTEAVEPESSGSIFSMLQDPATQYALAKAAQPTEGFVPRNFLSDVTLAKEEYRELERERDLDERRMQQEERGTALEQQLDMLAERGIGENDTERLNLLLSKGIDDQYIADMKLTLFQSAAKMVSEGSLKQEDVPGYVQQQLGQIILSGSPAPASTEEATTLSKEEADRLAKS